MQKKIAKLAELVTKAGHDYHIHDVDDDADDLFFLHVRDPENPGVIVSTASISLHAGGAAEQLFEKLLQG